MLKHVLRSPSRQPWRLPPALGRTRTRQLRDEINNCSEATTAHARARKTTCRCGGACSESAEARAH